MRRKRVASNNNDVEIIILDSTSKSDKVKPKTVRKETSKEAPKEEEKVRQKVKKL